jgi:antitoxin ChpS
MYTTSLRKVGGSIMLAVPPALLELLRLSAGSKVGLEVQGGEIVVKPSARPRYTLAELLQESDYSSPEPDDRAWADAPSVGKEPL